MLLIGSHVSFTKDRQLLGSLEEAISFGGNTFMFYTGAPQNTNRSSINDELTYLAVDLMHKNDVLLDKLIVHAPYIINLANKLKIDQYNFSVRFLLEECKRCEELGVKYLVLHPGSHVGCGIDQGIKNIAHALNLVLENTTTIILLETMAGKGTEIGSKFEELKGIIDLVDKKDQVGVCLDTCHLFDAGYDITNFDNLLKEFKKYIPISKIKCLHINDSKNIKASHKDRHANLGFGNIGFDVLINIIYNKQLEDVPKILETPYIDIYPPYKQEIDMIKSKEFNPDLEDDVINYYNK